MLRYLRFRYVKARMTAYINGELPQVTRRFIARQIDEDERCYNEYILQRRTKNELERILPTLGRSNEAQLNNIWSNIQAEMNKPSEMRMTAPKHSFQLGYGLVVVAMTLALLLPLTFEAQSVNAQDVPTQQPMPQYALTSEPDVVKQATINPTFVAIAEVMAQQTIEPQTASISTPVPDTPGT